jgi:hypothetical protein
MDCQSRHEWMSGWFSQKDLTIAPVIKPSSTPKVFNITDRTNVRAKTTTTVKPQKKPLIARIDGAFVEVSTGVSVDEVSPANLKIAGIAKVVFRIVLPTHERSEQIKIYQDLVPR